MDTLEKRIEMCSKAEEIQNVWKVQRGDWYFIRSKLCADGSRDSVIVVTCENEIAAISMVRHDEPRFLPTWLPRQDQLQDMVYYNGITGDLYNDFDKWYRTEVPEGAVRWSFEQLWLAYVMDEKYQKTWDGKEWVE